VIYEMLTGELPFGAFRYPSELFPDVPAAVDLIIQKCLAPRKADRYENAGLLLNDFRLVAAGKELPSTGTEESGQTGIRTKVVFSPIRATEAFVFRTGDEAFSLAELAALCEKHPDHAKYHLYMGQFEPWLRSVRAKDLSRKCAEIREKQVNQDIGLEMFLCESGVVARPRMELDLTELKLENVIRGDKKAARVFVNNYGRGFIFGELEVITPNAGWIVPQKQFFAGNEVPVEFLVSTENLTPGQEHRVVVRFKSNGGEINLPVSVFVKGRPALLEMSHNQIELSSKSGSPFRHAFTVANSGDDPLKLTVVSESSWIGVEGGPEFVIERTGQIGIVVNPANAMSQTYAQAKLKVAHGQLRLEYAGGVRYVPVRLSKQSRFSLGDALFGAIE
jgi:hypothetical protein